MRKYSYHRRTTYLFVILVVIATAGCGTDDSIPRGYVKLPNRQTPTKKKPVIIIVEDPPDGDEKTCKGPRDCGTDGATCVDGKCIQEQEDDPCKKKKNPPFHGEVNKTDMSIKITSTDIINCYNANDSVGIHLNVSVNGETSIPAQTLMVTLYAAADSESETRIAYFPIDSEIPAKSSISIEYDWAPFPVNYRNKKIRIRAIIDESNEVLECNKTNNSDASEFTCHAFG